MEGKSTAVILADANRDIGLQIPAQSIGDLFYLGGQPIDGSWPTCALS